MQKSLHQMLLVAAVATIVMFSNLGGTRLWDRDEPRNAGCALEMLMRGDWVTPVFNAELRTHKPVLLYWLMMTAYVVFGVGEFAARFWSAAFAVGTALCTYTIGYRLFRPGVGIWAGVIVATALMFDVAGRAATPDSSLIFFCALAITTYVVGVFPAKQDGENATVPMADQVRPFFPKWGYAIAMYAVMGVAMLAKGPVGLVLPTAVIGMFSLVMRLPQRDTNEQPHTWLSRLAEACSTFAPLHFLRTCWSMRPLTALAVSLAVALPWYIWVGVRTDGEFLRGFFLEHNLSRAMQTMEGHRGNLLFYPVAMLVGFFPWSVFAVPTLLDTFRNARDDDKSRTGYIFVACWVGVYVGLFSLAKTKLPSYVTPCYPALAIATACFIDRWTRNAESVSRLWSRTAFSVVMLVGIGMMVALPILAGRHLPGDEWLGLIGLVPFAGGIIALILSERQQRTRAASAFAITATVFVTLLFGGAAARVDRHQRNNVLLSAIDDRSDQPHITSFGLLEPTWVFYGGRTVDELPVISSNSTMQSWVEVDGQWIAKPTPRVEDLLAESSDLFVITTDGLLSMFEERYPGQFEVIAAEPYFLKKGQLLVLAPTPQALEARRPSAGVKR
ncbi:MAG: hypothetical protein CMJ64_05790 [Planctomycetaceae bacterium]|nr:hypothetical protein [Planctomycetaceae bacterium]